MPACPQGARARAGPRSTRARHTRRRRTPPVGNPTSRPGRRSVLAYGLVGTLFFLCSVVLAFFFGADLGVRTALLAAVLAALPLFVVVPTFLWLDRLEAEPRRYLVFAFLWGSLCAPVGALLLNTGVHLFFEAAGADDPATLSSLLSAPPVEEALKGLGILVILLFRRREFDGVLDGIVYAGLVGAGFAFSENILYLGRAYTEYGIAGLNAVFVLRCIMAALRASALHRVHRDRTRAGRLGRPLGARADRLRARRVRLRGPAARHLEPVRSDGRVRDGVLRLPGAGLRRLRRARGGHAGPGGAASSAVTSASTPTPVGSPHYEVGHAGLRVGRAGRPGRGPRPTVVPRAVASMRAFQDAASDLALLRSRMVKGTAEADAAGHERAAAALPSRRTDAGFVGSPVV